MNIFFLLFMLQSASAAVLARLQSSPDASSEQRFELEPDRAVYVKRSNFFDKKKDLTLGTFKLSSSQSTSKELAKVNAVLEKVKTVDAFLKKKNSSFNDLSRKNPHASFILLDEYYISQESDIYPELVEIFEDLQGMSWKQDTGIRLTKDFKQLTVIKDGAEKAKEAFNMDFYCRKREAPTMCSYKDLGVLYLTK